jgi:broad specificity phosphatase PhoE
MLLIRHAQSEWNLAFGAVRIDPGIPDPPITAQGRADAARLAETLAGRGVARLVASPYRRALQTAAILAARLGDLPITVEPLVRERKAFSCDTGTPPDRLAREWPELDFGALEPDWWGRPIESVASLEARARSFAELARSWPDRDNVAVVTHWGFVRAATGAELANCATVRLPLS